MATEGFVKGKTDKHLKGKTNKHMSKQKEHTMSQVASAAPKSHGKPSTTAPLKGPAK